MVLDAEGGGGVALGIDVNDQDVQAGSGQGSSDVHGGGGLAHAALLVGHREDTGFLRLGKFPADQPFAALVLVRELAGDGTGIVHGVHDVDRCHPLLFHVKQRSRIAISATELG